MVQNISGKLPVPVKKVCLKMLDIIGPLFFNEPSMRLAERYLRFYYAHERLRFSGGPHPAPEWFDHRADLYRWSELRNSFWVERGVFSREVMFEGCRVLDLCCGDGFYPYHFYAEIASLVDAVDSDPMALAHARKYHHHPKINYLQTDVVSDDFPASNYDVITWDGAIEHFSVDQIQGVLDKSVEVLQASEGILCGYTILARGSDRSHPLHQHEFSSAAELKQILAEFFPFVGTVETEYPERHNIYFRAAFDQDRLRRFD
jgi:ubiquinone/menaquinone biosynthesis C-methylase UbiE